MNNGLLKKCIKTKPGWLTAALIMALVLVVYFLTGGTEYGLSVWPYLCYQFGDDSTKFEADYNAAPSLSHGFIDAPFDKHEYQTGVTRLSKAIKRARKNFPPNDPRLAKALDTMGHEYFSCLSNPEQGIKDWKESLAIWTAVSDCQQIFNVSNELALYYMNSGDFDQAILILKDAVKSAQASKSAWETRLRALPWLAECYCDQHDYAKAIPLYKEFISIGEEHYGAKQADCLVGPLKQYSLVLHKLPNSEMASRKIDQRLESLVSLPESQHLFYLPRKKVALTNEEKIHQKWQSWRIINFSSLLNDCEKLP